MIYYGLAAPKRQFLDKEVPFGSGTGLPLAFGTHVLEEVRNQCRNEERNERREHQHYTAPRANLLVVFPGRFQDMQIREHLSLFQAHLLALLAQHLVHGFLHTDFCFATQVFGTKFRRLLERNHAHIFVLALQGTIQRRIHTLITLGKFLVPLAAFTAVGLLVGHLNGNFLTGRLQGAQVLDCRFQLNLRIVEVIVYLELDEFLEQGIYIPFTRISRLWK